MRQRGGLGTRSHGRRRAGATRLGLSSPPSPARSVPPAVRRVAAPCGGLGPGRPGATNRRRTPWAPMSARPIPAGVTRFGTLIGTRLRTPWSSSTAPPGTPSRTLVAAVALGRLGLFDDLGHPDPAYLRRITDPGAAGAYDAQFISLAQTMVAAGQGNAICGSGWEFNGIWFPWGADGHAAQFIAYWRHIVTAMRAGARRAVQVRAGTPTGATSARATCHVLPRQRLRRLCRPRRVRRGVAELPRGQRGGEQVVSGPYGLNWLAGFAAAHHKPMVFPEWGLGWGTCSQGCAGHRPQGRVRWGQPLSSSA